MSVYAEAVAARQALHAAQERRRWIGATNVSGRSEEQMADLNRQVAEADVDLLAAEIAYKAAVDRAALAKADAS